jgi:hypothetical protein
MRLMSDLDRIYGQEREPEVMPTVPHKHVYRSLFGVQHKNFGELACWCGKPMIYQVPEASNASV